MKIAITGTIGSGKTVVSDYLRSKGYDVFDCDRVNAWLLEENRKGYKAVKKLFPECFDGNSLDKKVLAETVFSDPEKKKKLEDVMHPLILKELKKRKDDPLFAEVPLLFEAGWDVYFDRNLLVVTDEKLLKERMKERGFSVKQYRERLKTQMPVEEKIKRADKIIYNNGSLNDLYVMIDNWLKEVLC
ncbi:MAG: dephospho-CoA kinase [Erysipelotrichaceae bacterium]|nr:dephospho-CoA kinase [Erysipelotrichaceae bacterium]